MALLILQAELEDPGSATDQVTGRWIHDQNSALLPVSRTPGACHIREAWLWPESFRGGSGSPFPPALALREAPLPTGEVGGGGGEFPSGLALSFGLSLAFQHPLCPPWHLQGV